MQRRRIIAREWLFFLGFLFIVTPGTVTVYSWINSPKVPTIVDQEKADVASVYVAMKWNRDIATRYDDVGLKKQFRDPFPPPELGDFLKLAEEKGALKWQTEPFSKHFKETITDPESFLAIILTYPLFLFLRSIVWSIRAVRGK